MDAVTGGLPSSDYACPCEMSELRIPIIFHSKDGEAAGKGRFFSSVVWGRAEGGNRAHVDTWPASKKEQGFSARIYVIYQNFAFLHANTALVSYYSSFCSIFSAPVMAFAVSLALEPDPSLSGDKVVLPQSVLASLLNRESGLAASPMCFALSTARGTRVFVGVREFSSAEGHIRVPTAVADALGLASTDAGTLVTVRLAAQLPRATRATLAPLRATFFAAADLGATLQAGLRATYTLLAPQQLVRVGMHDLLVVAVEPSNAPAAIIVDTDLVVDLAPALDGSGDGGNVGSIGSGGGGLAVADGTSQPLRIGETVEGKLYGEITARFTLPSSAIAAGGVGAVPCLSLETLPSLGAEVTGATTFGGTFVDAYVDVASAREPSPVSYTWALQTLGSGSMVLAPETASPSTSVNTGNISASVTGAALHFALVASSPPTAAGLAFRLRVDLMSAADAAAALTRSPECRGGTGVHVPPPCAPRAALVPASLSPAADAATGTVVCSNCGAAVPTANASLHIATCARNNVRCEYPGCGTLLRRGNAAAAALHTHCREAGCGAVMAAAVVGRHAELHHKPRPCPQACGAPLQLLDALRVHCTSTCPRRMIVCRFCGDSVCAGGVAADAYDRMHGLSEHEAACGSRTAPCSLCGRSLVMKTHAEHVMLMHPAQAGAALTFGVTALPGHEAADSSSSAGGGSDVGSRRPEGGASGSGGGSDSASSGTWACSVCTFVNATSLVANGSRCVMCGTARAEAAVSTNAASVAASGRSAFASGTVPIAVTPAPAPAPFALCRNACCSSVALRGAEALGLCAACHGILTASDGSSDAAIDVSDDAGDSDTAALVRAQAHLVAGLAPRYAAQARDGCGRAGCHNPACATAVGAAAASTCRPELQQWAHAPVPRYWVCVPARHERLSIPAVGSGGSNGGNGGNNNGSSSGNSFGSRSGGSSAAAAQRAPTAKPASAAARIASATFF